MANSYSIRSDGTRKTTVESPAKRLSMAIGRGSRALRALPFYQAHPRSAEYARRAKKRLLISETRTPRPGRKARSPRSDVRSGGNPKRTRLHTAWGRSQGLDSDVYVLGVIRHAGREEPGCALLTAETRWTLTRAALSTLDGEKTKFLSIVELWNRVLARMSRAPVPPC